MVDGKCSKNFPKPLCAHTIIDQENSWPQYKRWAPNDGGRTAKIKRGDREYEVDNSWVVPYNAWLTLTYDCHINVEFARSPTSCKYLYKYVTKGNNRPMVRTEVEGQDGRDEIAEYEDLRSVGSSEAVWHMMAYPIARKHQERELSDAHIPSPTEEELRAVEVMTGSLPVMIREDLDFNPAEIKELAQSCQGTSGSVFQWSLEQAGLAQ